MQPACPPARRACHKRLTFRRAPTVSRSMPQHVERQSPTGQNSCTRSGRRCMMGARSFFCEMCVCMCVCATYLCHAQLDVLRAPFFSRSVVRALVGGPFHTLTDTVCNCHVRVPAHGSREVWVLGYACSVLRRTPPTHSYAFAPNSQLCADRVSD